MQRWVTIFARSKTPERWPRIVELAARYGEKLPTDPDSAALNAFLMKMRENDAVHYADVSLAVIKLMGPEQLGRLVDDLLSLARLEGGDHLPDETVDIAEAMPVGRNFR